MPGAVMQIDQDRPGPSVSSGTPGISREDLWLSRTVNVTSTLVNGSQKWILLSKPTGSTATLSNDTQSTCSFTPDALGSYRLQLITNDGGPGNEQILICAVRYDNSGSLSGRGWRIPADGEKRIESNFTGRPAGYFFDLEFIFQDIRDNWFGGGLNLPITDAALVGAPRTLTLFEHTAAIGGDQLTVGGDAGLTPSKWTDFLTFLAVQSIDFSCDPAAGTMNVIPAGVHVANGKYFGWLDTSDFSALPAIGRLRFLYNGGSVVPLIAVKDHTGTDRIVLSWGAGDAMTLGNNQVSFGLIGYDLLLQAGTGTLKLQAPTITIASAETINAGTVDGETITLEAETTTTNAADHAIITRPIPTNSFVVWDVEVVAIQVGATHGRVFKRSRAFLNTAGVIADGAQKIVDDDTVGGAVGWAVAQDHSGTDARVLVNGNGDDVTWYVLASRMRILKAP